MTPYIVTIFKDSWIPSRAWVANLQIPGESKTWKLHGYSSIAQLKRNILESLKNVEFIRDPSLDNLSPKALHEKLSMR